MPMRIRGAYGVTQRLLGKRMMRKGFGSWLGERVWDCGWREAAGGWWVVAYFLLPHFTHEDKYSTHAHAGICDNDDRQSGVVVRMLRTEIGERYT